MFNLALGLYLIMLRKLQYNPVINLHCVQQESFIFWMDILDVALGSLTAVKAALFILTLSISSLLILLIFFLPLNYSVSLMFPLWLFLFSCFPSHSILSLFLFSFLLFPFEVLNNERATLHVKLIGKSRLKLRGTVQHSRILSSGPQGNERGGGGGGGIRSIVSMQWQQQWLHRALILQGISSAAWTPWFIFREHARLSLIVEPLRLPVFWQDM